MNLISIELSKFKVSKIFGTLLLFNMLLFLFLFLLGISTGGVKMFPTMDTAINQINNAIVWPACIMFNAAWSAKILIQELRTNTISNIWSCGIDRNRLMMTKILLILVIGISVVAVSTLLLNFLLIVFRSYMDYSAEGTALEKQFTMPFVINITWNAFCIGITGMLAMFFGSRHFSAITTIIAALGIAAIWASQISFLNLDVSDIRLLLMFGSILSLLFLERKLKRLDF
ncbi:ABC transporter permease [Paenibacillus sp. 2TAF8]|jgi:hypothetical protein|uniref:ABC transporter permease n=1 Tax=Paenibacillus sp. 2TAF8 TaxID=3233020 RepID=UPI003F95558E